MEREDVIKKLNKQKEQLNRELSLAIEMYSKRRSGYFVANATETARDILDLFLETLREN